MTALIADAGTAPAEVDSPDTDDVVVFHAGTARTDAGDLVSAGGRVLGVTALGDDLAQAQQRAYARVRSIHWEGQHYRSDIGHRGIGR